MSPIRDLARRAGRVDSVAADAESTAGTSQLPGAIATVLVALGVAQLVTGGLVAALTTHSGGTRDIVGRAIELTLATAPILLIALADAGQLRVRAPLDVAKLGGCAAVALAFQVVFDSFGSGVPSPLLTVPLRFSTVTGALVAARLAWLQAAGLEADGPPTAASSGSPFTSLRRVVAWCRTGPGAATLLAITVFGLTIGEFVRPRQPQVVQVAASTPQSAREAGSNVGNSLTPGPNLTLAHSANPRAVVVAYRGPGPTSALLAVSIDGRHVTISPFTYGSPVVLNAPVSFQAGFDPARVEITPMPGLGQVVAVALAVRTGRVVMEAHDLDHGGRLVGSFVSGYVGASAGSRDLRLAAWNGGGPDLFVIDRGLPGLVMRVRVFSQPSQYQTKVVDTVIGLGAGFPDAEWSVDTGPIGGQLPDIMLVSRNTQTGSHSIEAHVLAADTAFSRFLLQMRSTLVRSYPGTQNVFGYLAGSPTWFSVDEAHGRATPLTLRLIPYGT